MLHERSGNDGLISIPMNGNLITVFGMSISKSFFIFLEKQRRKQILRLNLDFLSSETWSLTPSLLGQSMKATEIYSVK